MKKRRLINLMLAGAFTTASAVAMTGCDEYKNTEYGSTVYIVMENKDEKIMHKGQYKPVIYAPGCGYHCHTGVGLIDVDLECGKSWRTNADCFITENEPKEDDYDLICEDCFSLDGNT